MSTIFPFPFIYPSLSHPPPLCRPLCLLCHSLCPLSALAFVWLWPESGELRQKNAACHGERAKVLALGRWWRGGRVSGLERHCQSWGYVLLFSGLAPYLARLLCLRFPLMSMWFFCFIKAVRARDGDCREKWGNATDVRHEAV